MYLSGRSLSLRKHGRRTDPRRIIVLLVFILGALFVYGLQQRGVIQPLMVATPTATRNPLSFAGEAAAQLEAGHLKEAALAYAQAIEAEPTNIDYRVALARVLIFDEQYPAALAVAEKAKLVAPDHVKTNAIYAWALDRNLRYDEAQAAAVKAIALDSNYAPAHAYYSEILNDAGFWDQGFAEAQQAIQLDPNLIESRWAMGYSNEVVGQYAGAIEHYQLALTLNPNLWVLYIKLGVMYRDRSDGLGDPNQAIALFSKANALDPNNVLPYLYLSRTYYQIDKSGTAIQYLESALTLQPDNPDIYGRLGILLFKRKNYEGAEPMLRLSVFGGEAMDDVGNPVFDEQGNPIPVAGMPLNGASLAYYYTLGNLRAYNQECGNDLDDAPALLRAALNYAPDDQTVQGSYSESMSICDKVLRGEPLVTPSPVSATPTP